MRGIAVLDACGLPGMVGRSGEVVTSFSVALVRHPRVLVEPGVCYGRLDLGLHPQAAADTARIAAALPGVGAVWSSPARRCRAVAEVLGPARLDGRLLELDFGDWEGMAWDAVDRAALDEWAAAPLAFAPPGGESGAALVARVAAFHATLRAEATDCVVVSHGGPLKVLLALLRGGPIDLLAPPLALGEVRRLIAR